MSADRAAYIAGLRKLADALEANEALPAPNDYYLEGHGLSFPVQSREAMVAWARLLDGATEGTRDQVHHVKGRIEGLPVRVFASTERLGGAKKTVVVQVETFEVEPFLPVKS